MMDAGDEMSSINQFTKWATDLQSLAQAGLHYGHDVFDRERYEAIRKNCW